MHATSCDVDTGRSPPYLGFKLSDVDIVVFELVSKVLVDIALVLRLLLRPGL